MVSPIRWGILGPGQIAEKFATGLAELPDAELLAIGSRSAERAQAFAIKHGAPRAYGSYNDLANDSDVDIIYIATPHPVHYPAALLCLESGKAVLCEKPFTVNSRQAAELIELARARNLFLMEAMWTRFLPLFVRLRELLAEKAIGDPVLVMADFGFSHSGGPAHRLFNRDLAGGALLDVGVYTISLASMVLGSPEQMTSLAVIGETGVDELDSITLGYAGGEMAQLSCSIRIDTPQEATIVGTGGTIHLPAYWWKGERMTVRRAGQEVEEIDAPMIGNGYNYEAAEAMRCVRQGMVESPTMPHRETLNILETLDAIRNQWDLDYPME